MYKAFMMFCVVVLTFAGCKVDNTPIEMTAVVVSAYESEDNKIHKFSGGMYQLFWDVTIEITEPEEHAGEQILVKIEDRMNMPADYRYKTEGTEIKFWITPSRFRTREATLKQLLKCYFTEGQ